MLCSTILLVHHPVGIFRVLLVNGFQINIDVSTDETEPELDVELTVRARQNSYIGLMAVDENTMILRPGYDITINDVAEDLQRYDIGQKSPYALISRESRNYFMWKPGSSNPHSAVFVSLCHIELSNSERRIVAGSWS